MLFIMKRTFLIILSMILLVLLLIILSILFWPFRVPSIKHKHHSNDELQKIIETYSENFPSISRQYTIGRSVRNHPILAIEISDNPGVHEPGEAEIKLIGNIHGNEVVGRELLLHLIDYLLSTYDSDRTTKYLVDNIRIHIVPSMNPDGYEDSVEGDCLGVQGRANANNIDLNRNFPDRLINTTENKNQEIETINIMRWSKEYPFVLSACLHGGTLVANYPFDNNDKNVPKETKSPDDEMFRYLALIYSRNHPNMINGYCTDSCDNRVEDEYFIDGITNGAAWYPVNGGMQDWNYVNTNCFELTIECGCKKYPMSDELENYWLENKNSLLKFINSTYTGVHGFVFDEENDEPIEGAIISVFGINKNITTYKFGDYWRLLTPFQEYMITASKPGYLFQTVKRYVYDSHQQNFTLAKEKI